MSPPALKTDRLQELYLVYIIYTGIIIVYILYFI